MLLYDNKSGSFQSEHITNGDICRRHRLAASAVEGTKLEPLELVTTVFNGYVDIPVKSPTTIFRNGKHVPLEVGEKFIIVKGDSKYFLPKEYHRWNIQHGNTGWMNEIEEAVVPIRMTDGTTYAVLESWYYEQCGIDMG